MAQHALEIYVHYRADPDWEPFFEIAETDASFKEKLAAYARLAHQRFDSDRFVEFCAGHLPQIDEAVWEFFGTPTAKEAVRAKVAALFPAHAVEHFTEHFWGLIQLWRKTEGEFLASKQEGSPA